MDRRLMLLRAQPFSAGAARGLVTADVLRGPSYRSLMHGAYQPVEDSLGHGRLVQAFRATHRPGHVLLGRSAAWAHGVLLAGDDDPVVVAVSTRHALARTRTVVPYLATLDAGDVVMTSLGPSTSLPRTAVDLARGVGDTRSTLDQRVSWLDALLRGTSLTAEEARAGAAGMARKHGMPTARQVLALCREGVDSPQETALRLLVVRASLPEPVIQCPVPLAGRVVARLDLGWPDARVGCEYDGAVHHGPEQVRRDLRRHNLLREAGWVVLQVDRHQMRRPDEVVRQLRHLLRV